MKNKLKIMAIVATFGIICGLLLCSCGGMNTVSESEQTETTTERVINVTGTEHDTGLFKASCPDGWVNIVQYKDDGSEEADNTILCFCKGTEEDAEKFASPLVYIYLNSGTVSEEEIKEDKEFYDETEDIEIYVKDKEYTAFHGKYTSFLNEEDSYEYDTAYIQEDENHYVRVMLLTAASESKTGITLNDDDLAFILNSIIID